MAGVANGKVFQRPVSGGDQQDKLTTLAAVGTTLTEPLDGSSGVSASGQITFADVDVTDGHTVSTGPITVAATLADGTVVPLSAAL